MVSTSVLVESMAVSVIVPVEVTVSVTVPTMLSPLDREPDKGGPAVFMGSSLLRVVTVTVTVTDPPVQLDSVELKGEDGQHFDKFMATKSNGCDLRDCSDYGNTDGRGSAESAGLDLITAGDDAIATGDCD